jgi:hypothetical protein
MDGGQSLRRGISGDGVTSASLLKMRGNCGRAEKELGRWSVAMQERPSRPGNVRSWDRRSASPCKSEERVRSTTSDPPRLKPARITRPGSAVLPPRFYSFRCRTGTAARSQSGGGAPRWQIPASGFLWGAESDSCTEVDSLSASRSPRATSSSLTTSFTRSHQRRGRITAKNRSNNPVATEITPIAMWPRR